MLDLGLPDMDGKDVIREVRAWSKVPIIVLVGARSRSREDRRTRSRRRRLCEQALRNRRISGAD